MSACRWKRPSRPNALSTSLIRHESGCGFVVGDPAGQISDPQGRRAAHQCAQAVHAARRVDGPLHCQKVRRGRLTAIPAHSLEVLSGRWRNDVTVVAADFLTPARRPLFSALNRDKFAATFTLHPAGTLRQAFGSRPLRPRAQCRLRGLRLPPWEAALRMAMER